MELSATLSMVYILCIMKFFVRHQQECVINCWASVAHGLVVDIETCWFGRRARETDWIESPQLSPVLL